MQYTERTTADWLFQAAAEAGADLTANMTALAGRSNYINEETLNGTPDPGAESGASGR